MALIKCPECGKKVSENAKSCPNCGEPIRKKLDKTKTENKIKQLKNNKYIIIIGIVCIVLLILFGIKNCFGGVELTKDNYKQYLDVYVRCDCHDKSGDSTSKKCKFELLTKGKSEKFNYKNIKITAKVKGTFQPLELKNGWFVKADKDEKPINISIESDLLAVNGNSSTEKTFEQNGYYASADDEVMKYDYEIEKISGKVKPA